MPQTMAVTCAHDGAALEGYAAAPEGAGPFPVVLVMHSALGIRHMVREKARVLAGHGFLAVATDMYGADADISDPQKAGEHYVALLDAPDRLRARTVAWLEAVRDLPMADPARIAAIGYCFGGRCVLELARSGADVKAVVSYHGLLTTHAPAAPGTIAGDVQVWSGARDPWAPQQDIEALREELDAAGARHQITVFSEAAHGFTDPAAEGAMPGIAYDPIADRVSWAGTLALLGEVLTR